MYTHRKAGEHVLRAGLAAAYMTFSLPLVMSDDEPHTLPVSAIVPHPLDEDEQPVAKANEIHEVNEEPQQPGYQATQVHAPEIGYRCCPADGGHCASISVAEGLGGLAFQQSSLDLARRMDALLHSHGSQSWQYVSLMFQMHHIADDEERRIIGDTEVGSYVHPPGPVQCNTGAFVEHSAQPRGFDSRRPHGCGTW